MRTSLLVVLPLALAASACDRGCGSSPRATADDRGGPMPIASAGDAAADASPGAEASLAPRGGRVFFGKSKTQNAALAVEELFVARDGDAMRAILGRDELKGATLDDQGTLKSTSASGESLVLALHPDGSFDGSNTYQDGSTSTWVTTPYLPLAADQLAKPTPFAGFLSGSLRYRMKLSIHGDDVEGFARYPVTREELRIRGKIHRDTRKLDADELGLDGRVTGHIDATIIGHPHPSPFSVPHLIAGTWSSPDGKRRLPMRLDEGFYPSRVTVGKGLSLSAQESYSEQCGKIQEYVYPVVDGAPAAVAKSLDGALKARTLQGPSADKPAPEDLARTIPGSKVEREHCSPKVDPELRGTDSGVFVATPLHDSWVAIEIEHYWQQGSVSGNVWHDCVAVDLATGELVEPAKLLDAKTRETLTARARKAAVASLADAGPPDPNLDGMREAAATLSLDDVPLCIEGSKVRFALVRHRVFGPEQPELDRDALAKMLPAGKLRDLVEKR